MHVPMMIRTGGGNALSDLRRRDEEGVSPHTDRVKVRLAQHVDPVWEQALLKNK